MLTNEDLQAIAMLIKTETEPVKNDISKIKQDTEEIKESLEEVREGTNEALKWPEKNYHTDFDRPFPVKDEAAS